MLTLYIKSTCPYCRKVLEAATELGIELNLKDIVANPEWSTELIERGGKRQVPYLVNEERGEEMYESNDIIAYLKQNYVH